MARAELITFSCDTLLPQQFQEFHPIGGVRAMRSPTTMRSPRVQLPAAFEAFSVTSYVPFLRARPEMIPLSGSSLRPRGRPCAS